MTRDEANARLFQAAHTRNITEARAALDAGADVNARDEWQRTPLHCAIEARHSDLCELLVEKGTDLGARDYQQQTALHWAARSGLFDLARLLVKRGADPAAQDKWRYAPFDWAFLTGQERLGTFLLDAARDRPRAPARNPGHQGTDVPQADPHDTDDHSQPFAVDPITAEHATRDLFHAIMVGNTRYAANAISQGADVNGRDPSLGQTPLHWAAGGGYADIVGLLIENGAVIDSKDKHEHTPGDLATLNGYDTIVEMLRVASQQQGEHASRVLKSRTTNEPQLGG